MQARICITCVNRFIDQKLSVATVMAVKTVAWLLKAIWLVFWWRQCNKNISLWCRVLDVKTARCVSFSVAYFTRWRNNAVVVKISKCNGWWRQLLCDQVKTAKFEQFSHNRIAGTERCLLLKSDEWFEIEFLSFENRFTQTQRQLQIKILYYCRLS